VKKILLFVRGGGNDPTSVRNFG